jgi:uroporphyrinogen-III synthase
MTRVLVTRPEPGATRTLNALIARGINANSIPLTEIMPLAFKPPHGDFDALIITSQNAITYGAQLLAQHSSKPVFVVGKRSVETLIGRDITAWAETAADLLPLIIGQAPKNLLYICGQMRRPDLENCLAQANIHLQIAEVYSASTTVNAGQKLKTFFLSTQQSIVLFHAPSAAEAFSNAMKDENPPSTTRFLCMSAVIAAQLPPSWQKNITLAASPHDAAMIDQLDKMLA